MKVFEIPLSLIGTILSICKEPGFLCIFKRCSWNSWVINILENLTLFGDCIAKHGWKVKWYFQNDQPFADKDSFKQCYTCINKQNHLLLCNSTNTSFRGPNYVDGISFEMVSCKHLGRKRRACLCDWTCSPWQMCTWFLLSSSDEAFCCHQTLDLLPQQERQSVHSVIMVKMNVLESFDYWFPILSPDCALLALLGYFSHSKGQRFKGCLFSFPFPLTIQNVSLA